MNSPFFSSGTRYGRADIMYTYAAESYTPLTADGERLEESTGGRIYVLALTFWSIFTHTPRIRETLNSTPPDWTELHK